MTLEAVAVVLASVALLLAALALLVLYAVLRWLEEGRAAGEAVIEGVQRELPRPWPRRPR